MAQTKLISDAEQAGEHVDGAGLSSFHNLTPRQQEVFDLLVAYIYQHGYPPTVQELAGLIGVTSPNAVTLHLRALHKKLHKTISRCFLWDFCRRKKGTITCRAAAAGNDR